MMDNVELQATCAALGYQEGNTYIKEPDCLETVKDLIRFLKREDEYCDVRRQLGEAQILQRDLIPIIKHYQDDRILLETVLRLMVNLTQPGKLCFQNVIPEDKTVRNFYLEVESQLQAYKEAFVDEVLFGVLTKKLGDLLQLNWEDRQEEDRLLIERILIIVRNILHVPPDLGKEQRTDDDASIHDQVLWALHISGMEDLLLYLGSSEDEQQFTFHVLEIVSLMFREQTPEQLASAGGTRSLTEKEQDEKELAMIREQEKAQKRANVMKYSSRHSRFGGTYTVANIKSISDRDMIYHRSLGKAKDISFDQEKRRKKAPKNRRPLTDREVTRRSTLSIRVFLKEFCVQFLENCYNTLMRAVKDTLMRSKAQENDETYYLWAMRFFMEFNRKYKFKVELVSETLSVPTFHYIQTHLQNFHEMIMSQKKEAIIWSRRMHLALKAYRELLESVHAMDVSSDLALRDSAKVIKSNVFYMLEYRDVFIILLRKFDETRQSRSFLKDLVETTHLFVKMLETFSKGSNHLMVQKKKKKKRAKKRQQAAPEAQLEPSEQELEDLWDDVSSELSAIFQGRSEPPPDVAPFDAASEVDVDQQRMSAMYRIQESLRQRRPGEAVSLLRAAREVWPEREEFGRPDIAPEEEFMALREVFFAHLPRPDGLEGGSQDDPAANNQDEEMDYEEEEEEVAYNTEEQEFNFKDFESRFSQHQIVRTYAILLADFKKNTVYTNHCILKMLHRIAFGCDNIAMMFHIKIFRIFQKVMLDPACRVKHFEELWQFAKYIVRKFFEIAQQNPKVFVELFFWKSSKESVEIVHGYGSYKERATRVKQIWTEEQDMELVQLYEQYKDTNEDGKDVVDLILENLIDQKKTRRQVLRQLINLSLIGSAKDVKRRKTRGAPRGEWTEEQEMELRQLFEEYRDSDDILGNLIPQMLHPRAKIRVTEKLLELGLVSDRRELYKRRGRAAMWKNKARHGQDEEESELPREDVNEVPEESADSDGGLSDPETSSSDSENVIDSAGSDSDQDDLDQDPAYVRKIKAAVRHVYRDGEHVNALDWIKRCLTRTADDREEDNDTEPIPIVPLQDEQEDAIASTIFCAMLKSLGLKKPIKQQERYWRIPGKLSPDDLRSRVAAIVPPGENDGEGQRKSEKNDRLATLKALAHQKKNGGEQKKGRRTKNSNEQSSSQTNSASPSTAHQESDNEDSASFSSTEAPGGSDVRKRSKKRSRGQRSSVQSSDPEESTTPVRSKSKSSPSTAAKPAKRARILEDSEDEDEEMRRDEEMEEEPAGNQVESDDEDKENDAAEASMGLETFPATMMSQPLTDSDSDLDDHVPLKHGVRRTVIESDSDED